VSEFANLISRELATDLPPPVKDFAATVAAKYNNTAAVLDRACGRASSGTGCSISMYSSMTTEKLMALVGLLGATPFCLPMFTMQNSQVRMAGFCAVSLPS
jgi:hypothetical protein